MGDWTPEPWAASYDRWRAWTVHEVNPTRHSNGWIASFGAVDDPEARDEHNARRTEACVNALAGIPEPAAYLKEQADFIERLEAELTQAREDAKVLRSIVHLAGLSKIGQPRNEFDDMIQKLYDKARTDGVFERNKP